MVPKPDKARLERYKAIDAGLGHYAGRISRFLWPWREKWLVVLVSVLALLDFTSTYILLELSGRSDVTESGFVAGWALEHGGFPLLLFVDIFTVVLLASLAFSARHLYIRHGHPGYGRAAFVVLLAPYFVIVSVAVVNNGILIGH